MRAELTAMVMALDWLGDNRGMSVVIFTDSLSALQALERDRIQNNLIVDILYKIKVLQLSDIYVNFEWIPSHCGIHGNEVADLLAKKGASKEQVELHIPYIKEEWKNHMSLIYKEIWQAQWESSSKGRHLFSIQPNVAETVSYQGLIRFEETMIHRLRLGKCKLNYYLYKYNQHENGLCSHCQVSETIEHFLLQCKKYERERRTMQRNLKLNKPISDLATLLGRNADYKVILNYVKKTKRFE